MNTEPLSPEDLALVRAAWEAATPGPWLPGTHDGDLGSFMAQSLAKRDGQRLHMLYVGDDPDDCLIVAVTGNGPTSEANMSFIGMAYEAMPRLMASSERLEAAGDTLAAIVERTARVANLPEERAAVAAWRAARGGQG